MKELKSVKLSPMTAKDAEGSVKPWSDPIKPKTPAVEAQGTDALKSYSEQPVETKSSELEASEEANLEDDWLVLDDVEEEDSHHGH